MLIRLFWIVLILLLPAAAAFPQNPKKIPVAVDHTGDDQVGQQVAFALKEAIRRSQSFRYVDHDRNANTARIVVYLVSLESYVGSRAVSSAISQSFVYDDESIAARGIFLYSGVMECGRDKTESCANAILPDIDRAVERLRTGQWSYLWAKLF